MIEPDDTQEFDPADFDDVVEDAEPTEPGPNPYEAEGVDGAAAQDGSA